MARQIRPENAPEVKARSYKIDMPDWSNIDKLGDMQIKAANENFKLYAETLVSTESAKLYDQFQNDPINLANALGKLPDMLKGLPEEIQTQMNKKMYLNGVSLVKRAQANQARVQKEEMKANAIKSAQNTNKALVSDFYNMLSDTTKPEIERSPVNKDIYLSNRINLDELADVKDEMGQPLFTESQKESMKMPKEAAIVGLQQFVEPMSKAELDDWKQMVFDERERFQDEFQVDDETYESMDKAIEQQKNIKEKEEVVLDNKTRIANSLAFLDNPIIYRAKLDRAGIKVDNPELADEIYTLSDHVGDGKVDPKVLHQIINKVASITVDDQETSVVDNNILKAYEADKALREAGANEAQLTAFHKTLEKAMTDTAFKQSVAALANKPSFDNMLLSTPMGGRRRTGLGALASKKDEDTEFVNKLGKEAYFEAMELMANNQPEEALSLYDTRIQQAYDYVKRDIIDVDYVKRELEKMGYAMVELNGNMSKIVGRLPNGEYIIEDTGEKINGGI